MKPSAQPPRSNQYRANSREGRLNFAQQAEMNLRGDYKPQVPQEPQKPIQRSNSYSRNNPNRPATQEEIRSALTLLKAKRDRDRKYTQFTEDVPDRDIYQAPSLMKAQSYQPQTISYEDIVAKEDKKPIEINEFDDDDEDLIECPDGCGRKFKRSALQKHIKICKKVFQEKRKAFDTKEQRIINQDHAKLLQKQQQEEQIQQQQQQKKKQPQTKIDDRPIQGQKKPKWKQQSEQFRAAMKLNKGVPLSQQEQVAIEEVDDRVQCEHCGRKFNEQTALKHIPSCKEKAMINQMKKKSQQILPPSQNTIKSQFNATNNFQKQQQQPQQQQQQTQNNRNNINLNGTNNTFTNTQTGSRRPPPSSSKKY
ncbi:unnamed protein product [Paramecium pentaurelia]|uniref:C2HC/C3H-type domain-containing protein n=1 Tax=Paramecium pentaurelia TaxID=43138 RepID=A0A8S1VV93_9CILI|nr:unnamed protein product [Paramecium pentaurelia]